MKYYIATLLNDDGSRHPVDRGGGTSEVSAARVAVRLANVERHNTCVVELDSKGEERITQRIFYKDGAEPYTEYVDAPSVTPRFMLAPLPLDTAAVEFITKWLTEGRSVTLSPARMAVEPSVNIVAHSS